MSYQSLHPGARRGRLVRLWLLTLWAAALLGQGGVWQQVISRGDEALASENFELAERSFEAAWDQAAEFGPSDPRRAETLMRLARVYRAQGDLAKPEDFYHDALSAAEQAYGAETPEYARCLNEVGRYFHTRRKYAKAHDYYRSAFAIRVRALGREHPEVAESLHNLAVLYENELRFDKAEVYYEYAVSIRETTLGPDHSDTIATLEHFARLLHKVNRSAEAEPMRERAQAYRVRRIAQMGHSTSEDAARIYTGDDPGIRPPSLPEQTEPGYTEEARIARHEGTVVLRADISPEGVAGNFRLVRSLGLGLDEKAVEAVKRWRFKPARNGNEKVAFRALLEINFRVL